MCFSERAVRECRLNQSLAIIKRACDAVGRDVVAEGSELVCLPSGDAAVGIQHDDAKARSSMEGGGHRRTGVARGRDQHGVLFSQRQTVATGSSPGSGHQSP